MQSSRNSVALWTRKALVWMGSLALGLAIVGCATSGRVDGVESDVAKLRQELESTRNKLDNELADTLKKAQGDLERMERVSREASERLARNSADLGAEMIEVRKAIDQMRGDMENTRRDLGALEKDFDLFRKDVDSRLATGPSRQDNLPTDASGLWSEGNRRFDAQDWAGARAAFQKYVESFPTDKNADNAQFKLGETFMNQGSYAEAVIELGKVVQQHKQSDVEDAAIFNIGESFIGLGKCDDAKAMFEGFISEYPKSKFKAEAKRKIQGLRKGDICR